MADEYSAPGARLIQFARSPVPGEVKTRLVPPLTPAQACDLHTELALWTTRQLLASRLGEVEVSVAGATGHPLFSQCRALGVARISRQCGVDLGERMYNAIREGLGVRERVLLVGSDCPGIDARYLQGALELLEDAPVVLGPAIDGGYVLIGARQIKESVFRGIPWGTGEVLARTRAALGEAGLGFAELPALADIDRPGDLPVWEQVKRDATHAGAD